MSGPSMAEHLAQEAKRAELEAYYAPHRREHTRLSLLPTTELLVVVDRWAHAKTHTAVNEGTLALDIVDLRRVPTIRGTHRAMVKSLLRSPDLRGSAERRGTRRQRRAAARAVGKLRKAAERADRAQAMRAARGLS